MTSALPTGLAAFVTLPRTCTKAGIGASDRAGTARAAMRVANAKVRRIDLLTIAGASIRNSFRQSQTSRWKTVTPRRGIPGTCTPLGDDITILLPFPLPVTEPGELV